MLKVYGIDELSLMPSNTHRDEALSALDVLGFNKKQSEKVVDRILQAQPEALVEQIIKDALKNL